MGYDNDNGPQLWPLLPNWKANVIEGLEFNTHMVGPTLTGMRQKRRMRIAPRRSFSFEVHPHNQGRRLLDNIRFAVGKREWRLPIWHDKQTLTEGLSAGSSTIPCSPGFRDFRAGGYAVLRPKKLYTTDYEIVQIDVIDTDHVSIVGTLENDWGPGTHFYPLRMARLADDSNNASVYNNQVSTLGVKMEVSEPCDWNAFLSVEDPVFAEHNDYPVLELGTDWSNPRSHSFDRIITPVDNLTSVPSYFDFPDKAFIGFNLFKRDKGIEDHARTRSIMYGLAGRYKQVWVPSYTSDLLLASDIPSSGTFDIENCRYSVFAKGKPGRDTIRIEMYGADGDVFYAKIADSEDNGDTERLYTNLSVEIPKSRVRRISFMSLMEHATDTFTITHMTDVEGVATTPFTFESVFDVLDRERGGLG